MEPSCDPQALGWWQTKQAANSRLRSDAAPAACAALIRVNPNRMRINMG